MNIAFLKINNRIDKHRPIILGAFLIWEKFTNAHYYCKWDYDILGTQKLEFKLRNSLNSNIDDHNYCAYHLNLRIPKIFQFQQ